MDEEMLLIFLIGGVIIAWMICAIVLPIVAIVQTRRLRREVRARLEQVEQLIGGMELAGPEVPARAETPSTATPIATPTRPSGS